jgi:hypothetical protein
MEELIRPRSGIPFYTTDAILAFSLYLVGVPFYESAKPCINVYDENILKKLGFTGGTIEEGVRKALARKKKGHVTYGFQRTAELSYLLKAYKDQEQKLQEEEGTASDVVQQLIEQIRDGASPNPMTMVRLCCVVLKMRVKFVNLWQEMDPLIRISNEGEVEEHRDDDGVLTRRRFPGFKLVSLNASKETKEKLKL